MPTVRTPVVALLMCASCVACAPAPAPNAERRADAGDAATLDLLEDASADPIAPENAGEAVDAAEPRHTCPPWCPVGNQPPNKNQ